MKIGSRCAVGLAAGFLLASQPTFGASALSKATTFNVVSMPVSSSIRSLVAVSTSSASNTFLPLTSTYQGKVATLFVKNFGTIAVSDFVISQTVSDATLSYCPTPLTINGHSQKCSDGSAVLVIGTGLGPWSVYLASPLAVGAALAVATESPTASTVTISIKV
jgi:hypothetical protein